MTEIYREPRIDDRKGLSLSDPFRVVRQYYNSEIEALFDVLIDASVCDAVKQSIRKYLIIVIFAALDYFFRNAVKNLVDDNDLDIAPLFHQNIRIQEKLNKLMKATTKGQIVASTYRFVDIDEIDFVLSNIP